MKSFQSEGQPITFQGGSFRSLVALHLYFIEVENESLKFESSSMPKLKVLSLVLLNSKTGFFSGLQFLDSIKEVRLSVMFTVNFLKQTENMTDEEAKKESKHRKEMVEENMAKQLAGKKNRPILKVL